MKNLPEKSYLKYYRLLADGLYTKIDFISIHDNKK